MPGVSLSTPCRHPNGSVVALTTSSTPPKSANINGEVAAAIEGMDAMDQKGTLSGTLDVIALPKANGYAPIISARSGQTEDPFIADLAVGSSAGQIKIGSLRTSSTVCKYNQLLRIEEHSRAPYVGTAALAGARR